GDDMLFPSGSAGSGTGGASSTTSTTGIGVTSTSTSTTSTGSTGGASATSSSSSGAGGCTSAADCDDGFDCTIDSCVGGQCLHVGGPNSGTTVCPPGKYCDAAAGCVPAPVCADDSACLQKWQADVCKTNIHCDGATATCKFDVLDKDKDG